MRRLTNYLRERVFRCRRAFANSSSNSTDEDRTKASTGELHTSADRAPQPLTHLDETGAARMVEISGKTVTNRSATAVATLYFSNHKTYDALSSQAVVKGNAVAVARLAAIQAAKKTSDLVPLAHPSLGITGINVDVDVFGPSEREHYYGSYRDGKIKKSVLRLRNGGATMTATVNCDGKTGVEMEAITAATIGAITMYDMLKAIDKGMVIMGARVIRKSGGKSGDWEWDEVNNTLMKAALTVSTGSDKQQSRLMNDSKTETQETTSWEVSTETWQPPISDIDEWNKGLTDEFSLPETSQNFSPYLEEEADQPEARSIDNKSKQSHTEQTVQKLNAREQQYQTDNLKHNLNIHTVSSETSSSIDTLRNNLLSIKESKYIHDLATKDQPNDRPEQLKDWRPASMLPIEREDLSINQDKVDSRDFGKLRRKRYEEGGNGAGGSLIV